MILLVQFIYQFCFHCIFPFRVVKYTQIALSVLFLGSLALVGAGSYFICPSSFMDCRAHINPITAHAIADMYIPASVNPAGRINSNNNAATPYRFDRLNTFLTFYLLSSFPDTPRSLRPRICCDCCFSQKSFLRFLSVSRFRQPDH